MYVFVISINALISLLMGKVFATYIQSLRRRRIMNVERRKRSTRKEKESIVDGRRDKQGIKEQKEGRTEKEI